jgi:hypothetical protein
MEWFIYEGHQGTEWYALKLPGSGDAEASLITFHPETGAAVIRHNVTLRAEGGGDTYRPVA